MIHDVGIFLLYMRLQGKLFDMLKSYVCESFGYL